MLDTAIDIGISIMAIITVANHIANEVNYSKIDSEICETYTEDEAVAAINTILSKYSDDSYIEFNDGAAKIYNSHTVTSRYDRQMICAIITRTDKTDREYDSLSAEWFLHNMVYEMHIMEESTRDADLDFVEDSRPHVRLATLIFEMLGWD